MRAILIDPEARVVSSTEVEDFDAAVRKLNSPSGCPLAQSIQIANSDEVILVDEEGALFAGTPVWNWRGFPDVLAGRALVLRSLYDEKTEDYELADTDLTVELVERMVQWTDQETTGTFKPTREGIAEEGPFAGSPVIVQGAAVTRPRTPLG